MAWRDYLCLCSKGQTVDLQDSHGAENGHTSNNKENQSGWNGNSVGPPLRVKYAPKHNDMVNTNQRRLPSGQTMMDQDDASASIQTLGSLEDCKRPSSTFFSVSLEDDLGRVGSGDSGVSGASDAAASRAPSKLGRRWRRTPTSCAPREPLLFAEEGTQFVPIPEVTGFDGYWAKDEARSTPLPSEVHDVIQANAFATSCHQKIQGLKISDKKDQLSVYSRLTLVGGHLPFLHIELYNKDHSISWLRHRRDFRLGRMKLQMFYTATNILILRLEYYGLFSSKLELIGEDYASLVDDGNAVMVRQCAYNVSTGKRATQILYATKDALPVHT